MQDLNPKGGNSRKNASDKDVLDGESMPPHVSADSIDILERVFFKRNSLEIGAFAVKWEDKISEFCTSKGGKFSTLSDTDKERLSEELEEVPFFYQADLKVALDLLHKRRIEEGDAKPKEQTMPVLKTREGKDHDLEGIMEWLIDCREQVFDWHPRLRKLLSPTPPKTKDDWLDERDTTRAYMEEQYKYNANAVKEMIATMDAILRDVAPDIFKALRDETGHVFTRPTYLAHPTLMFRCAPYLHGNFSLPLSCYTEDDEKTFSKMLVGAACHELSHFVWHERYHKLSRELGVTLDPVVEQIIKEIYAPVVLNNTPFEQFNLNENSYGLYKALEVVLDGGKPISLIKYLKNRYDAIKETESNNSFDDAMRDAISTAHAITDELIERWNEWGHPFSSDAKRPRLTPIEIKES